MRFRPSSTTLALAGAVIMGLGLYFAFLRPPLLAEDARYIGTSLTAVDATVPGLSPWLRHVFWVMGGFMFGMGLLTFYVAVTAFRTRARGATVVVAIAGAVSIGTMVVVNFLIASDFRWHLLLLAVLWMLAFALQTRSNGRKPIGTTSPFSAHHPTKPVTQ